MEQHSDRILSPSEKQIRAGDRLAAENAALKAEVERLRRIETAARAISAKYPPLTYWELPDRPGELEMSPAYAYVDSGLIEALRVALAEPATQPTER